MSKRIRAHVNPLKCRVVITEEMWLPRYNGGKIHIDIGCSRGEFAAGLAEAHPADFIIGVEIRERVAQKYFCRYAHIKNLVLMLGNINLSVKELFRIHKADFAYINFPDPYSQKTRFKKRRIINEEFVHQLFDVMNNGGVLRFQTDDKSLFADSHELIARQFTCISDEAHPDTVQNGTGITSAWEQICIKEVFPIYRAVYRKTS